MGQSKENAKAAKKAAKAELKSRKKLAKQAGDVKAGTAGGPVGPSVPSVRPGASPADVPAPLGGRPTAAERAAAAAERQVRLQRLRVWIALLTFLAAVATLLLTTKPWRDRGPSDAPSENVPATRSATP